MYSMKPKYIKKGFSVRTDVFDKVLEKVQALHGGVLSRYIQLLIENDLKEDNAQPKKIPSGLRRSESPIKDLTEEFLFPSHLKDYENAIAHEKPGLPRCEHELLQNLIPWTYKIIHNPDRNDIALMTIGELKEAMLAVYRQSLFNPNFNPREVGDLAGERIKAAKQRTHLESVYETPEPLATDPDTKESSEGHFIWISREEYKRTLKDFIKEKDLVPEEHIENLLDLLFDPDHYEEHLEVAEKPTKYNFKPSPPMRNQQHSKIIKIKKARKQSELEKQASEELEAEHQRLLKQQEDAG